MTESLPAPLTTEADEIVNYDSFMLNVDRLMASELFALSNGDEFKAAVALWCRAWKQKPAGSLPNDDRALAAFSGAGRNWKRVKAMALRGFIPCSDGRLYHAVLCEDVRRAAEQKRKRAERTRAATEARKAHRHDERNEQRNDDRNDVTLSQRNDVSTLNVTRSHSRAGQGRAVEERKSSDPNGSDAAGASPVLSPPQPPSPISDQDRLWRDGVPYLVQRGTPDGQARAIIGRWLKANPASAVLNAIGRAQAEQAVEPISFVTACLRPGKRDGPSDGYVPMGPAGG